MFKKYSQIILGLVFASSGFSQELPYSINYQDRGPVLNHATCRLIIYNYGYSDNKYLNSELTEFLSLKGYNVIEKTGVYYQDRLAKSDEMKLGDLTLTMSTLSDKRKHHHTGTLGYIDSLETKTPALVKEFLPFESKTFNMSPKRGRTSVGNGQYFVSGQPFTISSKKGRKALFDLYEKIPDCMTTGSGHSYEKEIYNQDIALNEINSCIRLYQEEKRQLIRYSNGNTRQIVGWAGFTGIFVAGAYPILWPAVGGLVVYHGIKGVTTKSLERQVRDGITFLDEIKSCYLKIQNGEECKPENYYDTFGYALSKKGKKNIDKYLEYVTPEKLTQKVADYLGSTRACSLKASKVRKVTLKKILKKTESTL